MSQPEPTPELIARYCHELFEVDQRGKAVLAFLAMKYSRPAVRTGGIDAVLETYHRSGAFSVIQFMDELIARGNGTSQPNDSTVEIDP